MDFNIPEYPGLQFGTIYCIGRNYASHIKEMKSEITEDPVVFLKPRSSIIFSGDIIHIPGSSINVHHEAELVLLIGLKTRNIEPREATRSVKAVSIGLDITARDIQAAAKKGGLPWTLSKGFDTFAPVGNFVDYSSDINLGNLDIDVRVNNEIRQAGNSSTMLFSCEDIISYLSKQFTLYPGDLIFTGTPQGVSQLLPGDVIHATLQKNLSSLTVYVQ
jgi:2-keto-4-pentenoate hydratase/2-oxohepta-3-ene-1,7-dioic acid hydratase in catechol pathway